MADEHLLAKLWASIESRKAETADGAPGSDLLEDPTEIRKKVEEDARRLIASHTSLFDGRDTKDRLAHAAADLWYDTLILLATVDVTPAEVLAVLERREALAAKGL